MLEVTEQRSAARGGSKPSAWLWQRDFDEVQTLGPTAPRTVSFLQLDTLARLPAVSRQKGHRKPSVRGAADEHIAKTTSLLTMFNLLIMFTDVHKRQLRLGNRPAIFGK